MAKRSLAWVAAALACSAPRPTPPHGPVVFVISGKIENGPFQFGEADLAALPQRSIQATDPRTARAGRFEGASLGFLLSEGVRLQDGIDTAVVTARDGYVVAIPVWLIRQYKPILARLADGKPLPDWASGAGATLESPYLVWPNSGSPGFDSDPRTRGFWASGVRAVELVRWDRTFGPALRVPIGSSDEARLGADDFSVQCMGCHRVRGMGGTLGPELTEKARGAGDETLSAGMRRHPRGELLFRPPSGASLERIASFLRLASEVPSVSFEEPWHPDDSGDEPAPEPPPLPHLGPGP